MGPLVLTLAGRAAAAALPIALLSLASAGAAVGEKLAGMGVRARPSVDDAWLVLLVALPHGVAVALLPRALAPLALLPLALAVLAVWLDAVLYRVFTIELGAGGVGGIVLAALYAELAELAHARRYFRSRRAFAALPLVATVGLAGVAVGGVAGALVVAGAAVGIVIAARGDALVVMLAVAAAALVAGSAAGASDGARTAPTTAAASSSERIPAQRPAGAVGSARVPVGAAASGVGAVAGALLPVGAVAAALAALAVARRRAAPPPHALRYLVRPRALPDLGAAFRPRPEHADAVSRRPGPPRRSPRFGALRGADVVLLTFESVGRDHLAAFAPGGAVAPLVESLLARAVVSTRHACVVPTTNDAHRALYASAHGAGAPMPSVSALRAAGYATVYLTAARTAEFDLAGVVARAGFEHVIDRALLDPAGRGPPSDYRLLDAGLDALAARLDADAGRRDPAGREEALATAADHLDGASQPGGDRARRRPLFLHVHATHTHLPYRVGDPARFRRFDPADDRGRFYDGIEETDALFAALLDGLARRGLAREPLLVVSSDHGQAFGGPGALGYQSHGSAVVKDELTVPLLLDHPGLAPARVASSSHFDVLPTVLDLVGVPLQAAVLGESILCEPRRPSALLVSSGHPSRATSSHFGLVLDDDKLLVDLLLDRCLRMDPDDHHPVELAGDERAYATALLGRLVAAQGLS